MGRKLRVFLWIAGGVMAISGGVPLISRLEFGRTVDLLERAGGHVHVSTAGNIVGVSFEGAHVADGELSRLCGLNHLAHLSLAGTAVTAAGLADLRGLAHLADLDISRTSCATGGLAPLQSLPALDTLRLHACPWVS